MKKNFDWKQTNFCTVPGDNFLSLCLAFFALILAFLFLYAGYLNFKEDPSSAVLQLLFKQKIGCLYEYKHVKGFPPPPPSTF